MYSRTPDSSNDVSERTAFYLLMFLKWSVLAAIVGAVVGSVASIFNHLLAFVTGFRLQNEWTLWLLPAAGLLIAFLYRVTNSGDEIGTDLVIKAVRDEAHVPAKMAPLIFSATALTHLFGGSAGREGAALQLGGSLGQLIGDLFRLDKGERHILVMCGMSSAFAALFGTPMAAAIFSLELASIGVIYYFALVPCVVSSIIGFSIATWSGIHPERFHLETFSLPSTAFLGVVLLAAMCGALSIFFCTSVHHCGHFFKSKLPNPYLRAFSGGLAVLLLTLSIGSRDYLGAGMDIIERAVEGEAFAAAFILKLLFTAITLGSGFKGGEIVPTLFVGATFGCVIASHLALPAPLGAALGMMALFCGVTNCPVASLILAFELFDFAYPMFFMLAVSISYMLSGCYGLYGSQKIVYAKNLPVMINRTAH